MMTNSNGINPTMETLVGMKTGAERESNIFDLIKLFFNLHFRINFANHEIWQPDISLINSINHKFDYYGATNFVVEHTGHVTWVAPSNFQTLCGANFRYWPFDSQMCTLQVKFVCSTSLSI